MRQRLRPVSALVKRKLFAGNTEKIEATSFARRDRLNVRMKLLETLLSSDFFKFAIPAAGAIIAWLVNERRKVRWEQYQRKEERYKELLYCLKGFYVHSQNSEMKAKFIDQVNLCWLYAPDEVIRRANIFLGTIMTSRIPLAKNEEKEKVLGEFILAIRQDMLSRRLIASTSLLYSDWKNVNA
jgi:hypothetical protein